MPNLSHTSQPLVSVIVPHYNHAAYLAQRMDSILNQTCQDMEIILIDDASSPACHARLFSYASHPKVRVILQSKNSGSAFKQWNYGARLARGKYLWIAESDDYAEAHFLETLLAHIEDQPDIGLVACRSRIVDKAGQSATIAHRHKPYSLTPGPRRWNRDYTNLGQTECIRYLSVFNSIPNVSATLMRRSDFLKAGGGHTNMQICGDWSLWIRLLKKSHIAYVAEPLNAFRLHASTTRQRISSSTLCREYFALLKYIFRTFPLTTREAQRIKLLAIRHWSNACRDFSILEHLRIWLYSLQFAPASGLRTLSLLARDPRRHVTAFWRHQYNVLKARVVHIKNVCIHQWRSRQT